MVLKLEDKKAIVAEVAEMATSAVSAVAADYRGLTVGQLNKLRQRGREQGVSIRVVRNTLARRALSGTEFECMTSHLSGALILAFSQKELAAAARLFRDFAKENEKFEIKLLALAGQAYGSEHLASIASLPTKEEAIATLMGVMKQPVSKFVRTLAEPSSKFVRTLAAVAEQRQAS